jgi:hypothetical protein
VDGRADPCLRRLGARPNDDSTPVAGRSGSQRRGCRLRPRLLARGAGEVQCCDRRRQLDAPGAAALHQVRVEAERQRPAREKPDGLDERAPISTVRLADRRGCAGCEAPERRLDARGVWCIRELQRARELALTRRGPELERRVLGCGGLGAGCERRSEREPRDPRAPAPAARGVPVCTPRQGFPRFFRCPGGPPCG